MWGSEGTGFEVKLIVANNSFTSVNIFYETDFFNSNDEPSLDDTIIINGNDRLIIRMEATAQTFFNNKPNIRMELRREGNFRVAMLVTSPNSHVHIWSNVRMNNRYTNWGVQLTNNFPNAERGNTDYGLGEPGGVGKSVITVASHIPDSENAIGNVTSGNLSTFSSIGPTVDGRVKPDISGPGQNILSSVNSFDPSTANNPIKVEFNGKEFPFDRFSGTSMSGPAVAGVVALMLQANDYLTAEQIREVIKETARLDVRTGEIGEEGKLNWGWGKINALAAVKVAEELPNFTSIRIAPNDVKIYPNPTQQFINIEGVDLSSVKIFDMSGRLVLHANNESSKVDVGHLNAGIYLIQIATPSNDAILHKFIKE
jgi:subtilisin family serine protease